MNVLRLVMFEDTHLFGNYSTNSCLLDALFSCFFLDQFLVENKIKDYLISS